MTEQRRRRIGQTTEEFIGGAGAVAEEPVAPRAPREGQSIDDDLDPSGRPYRPNDARVGGGNLGGGWGRIVRTVFKIDEEDAFEKIATIELSSPRLSELSYGEIVDLIDECSGRCVLASQFYENAKVVLKLYEADVEALRAPMRKQAREAMATEKTKGVISAEEVQNKMIELWPDEYRRQSENIAKAQGMVKHAGELLERWKGRARELDGVVRTNRKV